MLLHLLQTLAAHPSLAEGVAPPDLLHPTEQATFDGLRVVKRRRDWLLGRWTAKHLIQQYLFDTTATRHPLPALLILPSPDGAPQAFLAPQSFDSAQDKPPISNLQSPISNNQSPIPNLQSPIPLSLSISHSADRSFCALTDEPGTTVGADIERIEPREPGFVEQFFTPVEIAAIHAAPPAQRDTLITAIWSAKEAVLKALRVGLRADTRHLTCIISDLLASPANWRPFLIEFQPSTSLAETQSSRLTGWWRSEDEFVYTLVQAES